MTTREPQERHTFHEQTTPEDKKADDVHCRISLILLGALTVASWTVVNQWV